MVQIRASRRVLVGLFGVPLALLVSATSCTGSASYGALKRLLYETPGRDAWQKPEQIVQALELAGGEHIADIGAGGGYFTFRLANAVGGSGHVYAVDVDTSLLAYVASRARTRGLSQITTLRASETETGLAEGSVDLIFLAQVFHHLPSPASYFSRLRTVLRPGGRVAIVETAPGFGYGSHATAAEDIASALLEAGFVRVASHAFLPQQSYQIFQPESR